MLQPLIRPPVTLPDGPPQAAQGVAVEPRVLAQDSLAALSASVVNAALGERLAELSLSGQLPHTHVSSGLIDAVAELLQIQQQDGETLESYGDRILAALKDLSPQEQLKLQARLDSLIKGLSLSLLRALLVDPQGPSATRLAFMLELQANGGMRDAASQITSTYQETALADDPPPALSRDPAMQGPPRAPAQAARSLPFSPAANAASNALPANLAALPSRTGLAADTAISSSLPQPVNDDVAPGALASHVQTTLPMAAETATRPLVQPRIETVTAFGEAVFPQEDASTEASLQPREVHPAAAEDPKGMAPKRAGDVAPVGGPVQTVALADAETENGHAAAVEQEVDQPEEKRPLARPATTRDPSLPLERPLGPEAESRLVGLKAQAALLDALEHVTSLQMAEDEPETVAEKPLVEDEGIAAKIAPETDAEASVLNAAPALVTQKYGQNLHQQVLDDGSALTGLAQALLQMPMALREGIVPAYVLYPAAPDGAAESEDRVQPVEPEDEDRYSKGGSHSQDGQKEHQQQDQHDHSAGEAEIALPDVDGGPDTTSRAEDYYLRFADI